MLTKKPDSILLKLSGEMLAGTGSSLGINPTTVDTICTQISSVHVQGVKIAIVVGGGNIIRGAEYTSATGMDRATADYMGMMGTVINGLALQHHLEKYNIVTRLQTATEIKSVAEPYIRRKALRHLEKGRIVIFAGGTGNPFFTTDTAAALRAIELGVSIILKGTMVDGVYDCDPEKSPNAKRYRYISFMKVLQKRLQVMDATAFSLCMENNMPICVFNFAQDGILEDIVCKQKELGTLVNSEDREVLY